MKKKLIAIALGLALGLASTSAMAWSDREQGALLGAVIGGVLVNAHKNNGSYQQHPAGNPTVIYAPPMQPQPTAPTIIYQQASPQGPQLCGYNILCPAQPARSCWIESTVDSYGYQISQRQVCR